MYIQTSTQAATVTIQTHWVGAAPALSVDFLLFNRLVFLARQTQIKAVVVENTFTSIEEVAPRLFPLLGLFIGPSR